jgi:NAD(P)H-quinone oxidoreductase subunit M
VVPTLSKLATQSRPALVAIRPSASSIPPLRQLALLTFLSPLAPVAMADTLLKCTTRHIRLFTARVEGLDLVQDPGQLTLDLDPDNEFLWDADNVEAVQSRFRELVASYAGAELSEYNLRRIGSELEGVIRQRLQAGQLRYNPAARVLNYSMGLPRTPDT